MGWKAATAAAAAATAVVGSLFNCCCQGTLTGFRREAPRKHIEATGDLLLLLLLLLLLTAVYHLLATVFLLTAWHTYVVMRTAKSWTTLGHGKSFCIG